MSEHSFDVVVLGAGPAGEVVAGRLAERGRSVAMVEPHLVGGECSYYACMPSKALLRPAQALAEARRVPGAREAAEGHLDAGAALARRDEVIHHLHDDEHLPWLKKRGVALFRGHGRLDGERRVEVDGADEATLTAADAVVIATGSAAALAPIDGLEEAHPWTNREATTAEQAPESLIVLGGGPVGSELAQAWSSLGSRVTLIESQPRLLPQEEPFASEQVLEALRDGGVEVRVGASATAVRRDDAGVVTVEFAEGEPVSARELLVALGRRPHTDSIGLDSVGLEPGETIEVDDSMRVPGHDWLFAVGDVNGRVLLTHMGKYQARVAADTILGQDARVRSEQRTTPRVVFTEPQVAAVGLTLGAAREQGMNVRAVDYPSSGVAGGSFYGRDAPGTSRLVVDEERRVLVGATFTGVDVAEWLHAATIAVVAEVPLSELWHSVPCFPSRSEVWLRLLEGYGL